jgi:hypothetical protein
MKRTAPQKLTLRQAGYQYIRQYKGGHLLYLTATGAFELWYEAVNRTAARLTWKNTALEFAQSF